jgi:hypothetical protein
MFYLILRDLHNLNRWLIVGTAIWTLIVAYRGWLSGAVWTAHSQRPGLFFTSALNVQLLLGLLIYALGPFGRLAFTSFSSMLDNGVLRFFTLEHPVQMVIAVLVAQAGYSLAKRAGPDRAKFRRAALYYSVAVFLIALAIPWPPLEYGRPLLPQFSWVQG